MSSTARVIGIAWYDPETYPKIRTIMVDGLRFPKTFEQWLRTAEQGEREYKRIGIKPTRVHLEPDQFLQWCKTEEMSPDSSGRITFATRHASESQYQD